VLVRVHVKASDAVGAARSLIAGLIPVVTMRLAEGEGMMVAAGHLNALVPPTRVISLRRLPSIGVSDPATALLFASEVRLK